MQTEANWAGNVVYRSQRLHRPTTVEQVQELVAGATKANVIGSRHSFNLISDTAGELISLVDLEPWIRIDAEAMTVSMSGGTRYGELGAFLQANGYALANLASLPHISVAGAVATATHGSGTTNQNLAAAVAGLELVTGTGELRSFRRGDADFEGVVVGLGALGVVTSITLDIEQTYDVATSAFDDVPWSALIDDFAGTTGAAYSVSSFTDFNGPALQQVWLKQRLPGALPVPGAPFHGGRPATERRHCLPGLSAEPCTEQMGIAGPWVDRLPHFRLDFTPSNGAEIQSEYLMPIQHAPAAIEAVRALGPRIAELVQVAEIRTMAADDLWLSGASGTDTVGFHFTWRLLQAEVEALLPDLEAALAPFQARPHWGKVFTTDAATLASLYPKLPDFRTLAEQLDPEHTFRNDFLDRTVFA